MALEPEDHYTPEYIYDGFEIDDVLPVTFAGKIQAEVERIGGCVVGSTWEGSPELGKARAVVACSCQSCLATYIWRYYVEGDLDDELIEQEIASIIAT